ncbi:hypothetical protein G4B88_017073 [Cannabis sativa]|uniref:Endonuclease/exonuclease/phosphatase domain-containing protein n=1 Tax=Cannabis sativa TaxID=3483 RepID=A0A7J6DTZ2_CANSA|nr:hypothetical protein G4B88_017073 [Cannabis sativa]
MVIVSWKVRGLNGDVALRQTKLLLKYHKTNVIFFMETKLAEGKLDSMKKYLGFEWGYKVPRNGLSGGLMLLWKGNVEISNVSNRHNTWQLLKRLRIVATGPWMVGGDFNEILSNQDKEGGNMRRPSQMEAFQNTLELCALHPLPFTGERFTWAKNTNGSLTKQRLDWVMVNEAWTEMFPINTLTHLDYYHSDHRALIVNMQERTDNSLKIMRKRPRFRFENMSAKEFECQSIIKDNWSSSSTSSIIVITSNIQRCSTNLSYGVMSNLVL